ncbi:MAG: hydrogenase maturation nickel metallochaperone HypA [Deltaproteobacteria bacterium]|nr:hydrogenase maturation nickel metallochaperone HypA [Deltaproteobacteria bacterium]MBW2658865.1 hydrogenase maturation nickel metallochaperone HypA [Deltaproteobacteria bacterium]
MHEISLVQGLFHQLEKLARENNGDKIISVTMEIGPLSGIVIDSFRFGFDVLSADNDLIRGAELIIEVPPATYTCVQCGHKETTSDSRPDKCIKCGDLFLIPTGGEDLILNRIEME